MSKHFSSTFAIAEACGVHPNTVRNFLKKPTVREWHKLDEQREAEVVAAIQAGQSVSATRPLAHAPPIKQLSFAFD